jgi:YebC/PmpR family DNA-binding regulatory protein
MAGHSKWANIKHRKGRQDAKRGKVFTRLAKEITISAKEGGGDVETNPRLRLAVQNAKGVNMPMDNITRAIKKGTGEIEGVTYEEYTYEGYGPNGIAIILETVTDNKNRTVAEVRALFTKHGGNLGETNSVAWNFNRKGIITLKNNGKSEDEMMEFVLESGAEDLEYDEETSRVISTLEDFSEVNKFFEESEFEVEESKLEYVAQNTVKISDVDSAQKIMKFIDAFEDNDDVQNVFSNVEMDDSVAEQLQ